MVLTFVCVLSGAYFLYIYWSFLLYEIGPVGPSSLGPSFCHFLVPILGNTIVSLWILAPHENNVTGAWQKFKTRFY